MIDPKLFSNALYRQNNFVIVSRMCHWNVRGRDFYEYHLLFERVYNIVAERVDKLVEVLRAYDYYPTFEEFKGPGGSLGTSDQFEMIDLMLTALNAYYKSLDELRNESKEDAIFVGLVNLLEELMQDCTEVMYLLGSTK